MKYCIVTTDFLPEIGGIASHIYNLANSLVDLGHEVRLFFINNKETTYSIEKKKTNKFYYYEIKNDLALYSPIKRKINYSQNTEKILKKIIKILESEKFKPDIVHCHTLFHASTITLKLSRYFNAKAVFTNHSSNYLKLYESVLGRILLKKYHKGYDLIIAPSMELKEKSDILKSKTVYIPNGVNTKEFIKNDDKKKLEYRKKYSINIKDIVGIVPRRIVKKNGVRYLIEAIPDIIKEYKSIVFVLVGTYEKEEMNYIENFIRENKLESYVNYVGALKNIYMKELYALSDFCVMPSLKEAVSIAALESLSSGLPIIASNVGGLPEIVKDKKNGYLVEPANSEDLSKKILLLIRNPDKRKQFSEESLKIVKEYDWEKITKRTITEINNAIHNI